MEGAAVAVTDIDKSSADKITKEIQSLRGKSFSLRVDVTDKHDIDRMISTTIENFGKLDIFIANAGIVAIGPLIETEEKVWDRLMDVNAKGVFLSCPAAARQMIDQGNGGRIIINASGAGKVAPGKNKPLGVYAATKHAVVGFGKQLGLELSDHQILVNSICGGIIDTPMWDFIDREVSRIQGLPEGSVKSEAVAGVPLGRIQKPEDIANVVAFLVSDDANYITASALNAEGGILPC